MSPGPGGFSFGPFVPGFNPGGIATFSGVFLAVVLTVQGLTGWEAAVPLAEETSNPRRNVPRSIMASILIIGIMLVIAQWGQVIGWGTDDLTKLQPSAELPALVIAHRIWGSLWWLTLLAMVTSVFGVTLACQNVATRMWYSMGRVGVLPATFGRVHPTRKTPTAAIWAQLVVSVAVGIVGPWLMGTWAFFIFLVGYTLVLAVIFVYIAANIGLVKHFMTKARSEFNFILHFIFPVGTSLVLLYSIYAAFWPLPAAPNNYTPLVAAGWLAIGIAIVLYMKASGRADWLTKVAEVIAEREATASEKPML